MGFLSPAEAAVARGVAVAMTPPPPPDITRWCTENVVFDDRSPMPGPFNIERFPFLREIHEVLSPEHPAREVTVKGSAQWGKTVSVINPTLGAWFESGPDPVVATASSHIATSFVRVMLLPAEWAGKRSIHYLDRPDPTAPAQTASVYLEHALAVRL